MDRVTTAISIIELATSIIRGSVGPTSGTNQTLLTDIQALEQIAMVVARGYQELAGKPIDTSLLTEEEHID